METFVVRIFMGDGVTQVSGLLEHPMTGTRIPFRDLGDLTAQLVAALEGTPGDAPSPRYGTADPEEPGERAGPETPAKRP